MATYQAVRKSLGVDQGTIDDANYKIQQTIKGAILIMCLSSFIEVVKAFYLVNGDFEPMSSNVPAQKDFIIEMISKFWNK